MIAKLLLPTFGGGASIWITSLVFFQVMLLLGYGMTHWVIKTFGSRLHIIVAGLTLLASLLVMPLGVATLGFSIDAPAYQLLAILLFSVGLPYLMLSTTSPTLQHWMANDSRMQNTNPYVQYGVSNAGSLLGLMAYPFIIEPALNNSSQTMLWTVLYAVYALVVGMTLFQFARINLSKYGTLINTSQSPVDLSHSEPLKAIWFVQAMVPSALLLGITHYLTLDVVNFPLLWVAPLALYLLTFIICFLFPAVSKPSQLRSAIAVVSLLLLMLTSRPEMGFNLFAQIGCAMTCLFFVAMVFHGDLERNKPEKHSLTGFYLVVSAGGAAGSVLMGLVAPLLFESTFEFSIIVLAALYYLIATGFDYAPNVRRTILAFVFLALGISYVSHETRFDGQTITRARSFYGTYAVRDVEGVRRLVAGTHVHGEQYLDAEREHTPLAYFHAQSGVGKLFELLPVSRVAMIGLGIGSLVEYGDENTRFDIFELDAEVIRLANEYFSVLTASPSSINYYVGDGRISLQKTSGNYDLIVMDAFTSGAIPMHLVTVESLREAFEQLNDQGAIAYHISNHHVDLLPVLNAIADELNVDIRLHQSISNDELHLYPARWVVLSKNNKLIEAIDLAGDWQLPDSRKILWRDEASDIRSVLRIGN